jgi:hypothetical protein
MVYQCFVCGTKCDTHKRYEKHCQTAKHLKKISPPPPKKPPTIYECFCGNVYSHKPSLLRHHRTCEIKEKILDELINGKDTDSDSETDSQCSNRLNTNGNYKQHTTKHSFNDLPNVKQRTNSATTGYQHYNNVETVNNTINKTNMTNPVFNFNIYLDEQCRDAVCIEDFCNAVVQRIRSMDATNPNVNVNFVDNRATFDHLLGNLLIMNAGKRPIQSFQGEIVEKSQDDWKTLTLDKLNDHVTGITSQVNWAKFSDLPQPTNNHELMQNMIALKAATTIHPPLHNNDMNHLQKATDITRCNSPENIKQLVNQIAFTN